jgi:hypothetical protein
MTNQLFCYWLQGYIEISQHVILTKSKINLIDQHLNKISEPLGDYTRWLKELLLYLQSQDYRQPLLDYFLLDIRDQLSLIFYHVIDNSYDTEMSHLELKHIHDGLTNDK